MNENQDDKQVQDKTLKEKSALQTDLHSQIETKKSWFNNKLFMGFAIFSFVFLAGLTALALSDNTEQNSVTQQPAEQTQQPLNLASALALVEGTVEFSTNDLDWRAAEGGETINVGDSVRTSAASRAVVLLDDGSAVRLDENSKVTLTTSDENSSEVLLIAGQVYSRVIESETRVFAVVTNNERFEALGTAFKTSTDDVKDSLEVYQSKVKVESDETEVEEGNKYSTDSKEKSSIDIDKLTDDEFVQWNKDKDQKDDNFKDKLGVLEFEPKDDVAVAPTQPSPNPTAALTLSGSKADKGVYLSWTNSGVSAGDGFKVVYSKDDTTPSYKENSAQYVGAGASSYTVKLENGGVYYFRVCAYRAAAGTCESYSNTVTVTAPVVEKEPVVAGAVTLAINGKNVTWSIAGTAPHGFKVLLNSTGTPTYPSNSIQYVVPGSDSATLPEKPAGTYYVRVCKYTADGNVNGGCTDYSNEVMYVVASE